VASISSSIATRRKLSTFNNEIDIRSPMHPATLMVAFWFLIVSVYFLGPIYITPEVSYTTAAFLALHILFFILGSTIFSRVRISKGSLSNSRKISYVPILYINRPIFLVLFIGVFGGIISIYSKLSILEVIDFSSITQLRALRAQALLHGVIVKSSLMPALGFLTYPAGFIGIVVSTMCYEQLTYSSKIMSFLFVLTIIFLAVFSGGRSPIMVLVLFIGISCYARKKMGKSYIPKSLPLRLAIASLLLMFVVYSSFIWTVRTKESGLSTNEILNRSATVWGAYPKEYLLDMSSWLDSPGLTQNVLSTTFYFIHNLSISERLLSSRSIPTLYGAYQIDVLAALFRMMPSGAEFLENGYGILLDANVYGFFTGAWTGLFIDFGYLSFFAALLWGVFAGKACLKFKRNPNVFFGASYVFWSYSIFISFVSAPFGFSNSLMIFLWFVLFSFISFLFTRYTKIK
jgi:oligosaccharide repeat unit polymerase